MTMFFVGFLVGAVVSPIALIYLGGRALGAMKGGGVAVNRPPPGEP